MCQINDMIKVEFLIDFLNSQAANCSDQVCLNMATEATAFVNANTDVEVEIEFNDVWQRFSIK